MLTRRPRGAGQEDQLLTGLPVGAHTMDILGTTKDLQPSEWTRGSGATVPIDLGNSSCGWTAHVSLQARQE